MKRLRLRQGDERFLACLRAILERDGLLLVVALPGDADGRQLHDLVGQLGVAEEHDRHGKTVWHIRYDPNAAAGATASLTMEALPFHTDGSFEDPSPRFLAQYVVREDRFGGGQTLLVKVADILERLSPQSLDQLRSTTFRFHAPAEYAKGVAYRDAPILFGQGLMRYRRAIIDGDLSPPAKAALDELDSVLAAIEPHRLTLRRGELLLIDNARFLHARTAVTDPERHLLRVRFSLGATVAAAPVAPL